MTAVVRQQSLRLAPRLAVALSATGRVAPADLARAEIAARAAGKQLDQALLELGLVTEALLQELLRTEFGIRELAAGDVAAEPVLGDLLAPAYLATASVLPAGVNGDALVLAMVDPLDDFTASAVALKTGRPVIRRRISRPDFERVFEALHGPQAGAAASVGDAPAEADTSDMELLRDAASDAPVIRFVQETIRAAVDRGASDIQFRPLATGAELVFRIRGDLVRQPPPDARMLPSILSRLKILANLDISERRLPQDGRVRANVGGRPVDIRLSTMPHIYGEAATLRLLSRELAASSLADLGFSPGVEAGLGRLFSATDGLILVTGPTGSGKSTTLHAALKQLIRPDRYVVTIEDPVEYRVDGAAQIQVDEKIGLTFPRVLRSLLRHYPNVVMIGEIRDAETAEIAVRVALTGHLVLATLHTNSALATVSRLVDMGIEPYLAAAVLRGVLAQRLVRRLCPHCSVLHDDGSRGVGSGCSHCAGTGYAGRVAIGELALLDTEITEALSRSLDLPGPLGERLAANGYRPLAEDATDRVRAGDVDPRDIAGALDATF